VKETIDLDTPKCFFHYTTREAALEHIVPSGKLRFSTYERMRDPLESRPPQFTGSWFVAPEEEPHLREKQLFQFYRGSHGVFEQAHLLAFTVDAEDYEPGAEKFAQGWSRARMWEHYAEKHAGICLAFDFEKLIASLKADLREQLGVEPYHAPVEYTETGRETYQHLMLGQFPEEIDDVFVNNYIEEHHDELFFQKVLDWQTEYEYRFVTTATPERPLYADYGDSLVGVVAGSELPDWERPGVIETAHDAGIEPVIMSWSMGVPIQVPLVKRTREEREQFEQNFAAPMELDSPEATES
jgi:hypothetical protein